MNGEKMKYPMIFVHGMFGWGENEGINKKAPYWGGTTGSLTEYLSGKGVECYAASVGPVSSAWDQACELYAQLKGTRVDYGENHSRVFGHRRYGRTYKKPLFENWGKEMKVHLIGHSFGGNTIRLLTHLLKYGAPDEVALSKEDTSPLFAGGNEDMVCSITAICSPLNGTDAYDAVQRYGLMKPTRFLSVNYVTLLSRTKLHGTLLDFHLEQMGVNATEDIKEKKKFFQAIKGLLHCKESIDNDMSAKGTEELNAFIKTVPSVCYFSYPYNMLVENKKGKLIPDKKIFPVLRFTSKLMIRSNKRAGRENIGNDGLVDINSAMYPKNEPYTAFVPGDKINPGIWNVMPIGKGDHGTPIGLMSDKEETHNFYDRMVALLKNIEN